MLKVFFQRLSYIKGKKYRIIPDKLRNQIRQYELNADVYGEKKNLK
jgi:hypothetical protein